MATVEEWISYLRANPCNKKQGDKVIYGDDVHDALYQAILVNNVNIFIRLISTIAGMQCLSVC